MREILFRGKRTDDGKWIEGYLIICGELSFIVPAPIYLSSSTFNFAWYAFKGFRVDPATVGQYTGLTDKDGKKIFEGDIIKSHYANSKKADHTEIVVFNLGRFCAYLNNIWQLLADGVPRFKQDKSIYMEYCEVIGNIHDNPELIREE